MGHSETGQLREKVLVDEKLENIFYSPCGSSTLVLDQEIKIVDEIGTAGNLASYSSDENLGKGKVELDIKWIRCQ